MNRFYSNKYENKTIMLSSTILIFVLFIIYVGDKYFSGFIFRTIEEGRYTIGSDFALVFAALLLIIISNYLICTINDGIGSFRHIFSGFVYSFAPYIIFKPFLILTSNVLTLDRKSVV